MKDAVKENKKSFQQNVIMSQKIY